MSLFKKITKSIEKTVTASSKKLLKGDIVGSFKSAIPGYESAKTMTGMSGDKTLAVLGSVGAAGLLGAAGSAGAAAGSGGLLGSLFGSDNNSGLLGSIFGTGGNSLSSILGSVVKGAVGIGADYFANQQYYKDQRRLNEQTFAQNRQLADEAYQRDVAMWRMQNIYNSPARQMSRLESAGLNPNLVYGGGNVTGNTAGSPPSYPQVTVPSSKAQKLDLLRNVLGIFDEYQSIKNQALDNQREAARIALQSRALDLQEDRERNKEKNDERRFQILLANLGFQERRLTNEENKPQTYAGKIVSDISKAIKFADKYSAKGSNENFIKNRVNNYNNNKSRYIKGVHY